MATRVLTPEASLGRNGRRRLSERSRTRARRGGDALPCPVSAIKHKGAGSVESSYSTRICTTYPCLYWWAQHAVKIHHVYRLDWAELCPRRVRGSGSAAYKANVLERPRSYLEGAHAHSYTLCSDCKLCCGLRAQCTKQHSSAVRTRLENGSSDSAMTSQHERSSNLDYSHFMPCSKIRTERHPHMITRVGLYQYHCCTGGAGNTLSLSSLLIAIAIPPSASMMAV